MPAGSSSGCLRGFSPTAEAVPSCSQRTSWLPLRSNGRSFQRLLPVGHGSKALQEQFVPPSGRKQETCDAQRKNRYTGQVGDCAHQMFWGVCHNFHEELHFQLGEELDSPRHDVEQVREGLRALITNIFFPCHPSGQGLASSHRRRSPFPGCPVQDVLEILGAHPRDVSQVPSRGATRSGNADTGGLTSEAHRTATCKPSRKE